MLKQICSRTESSLSRPIFFFDTQNLLPGKYFLNAGQEIFFGFSCDKLLPVNQLNGAKLFDLINPLSVFPSSVMNSKV